MPSFLAVTSKGDTYAMLPFFGAKHLTLNDLPHRFSFVKLHAYTGILVGVRYKNSFNLNYLHTESKL